MQDPVAATPSLPRPGRMMRIVLATIAIVSVVGAIVFNWAPGPPAGPALWRLFACSPDAIESFRIWSLVTSGVLTAPQSLSHVFFALLGLYFFTPQLEKSWGGGRLLRMLLLSVVVGNLTALLADRLMPVQSGIFHPPIMFGPGAALAAVVVAWSREHPNAQVRLFLVLPVSSKILFWMTIAGCVLGLVYYQGVPEGAVAPFGGVAVGLAMGGHPSPARALWLRLKLAVLRRRGAALTVEQLLDETPRSRPTKRAAGKGGPSLRVVQGGLEDELKNRKPPKDKRYLN
jgi:membrane associated rhomboid family serine protease